MLSAAFLRHFLNEQTGKKQLKRRTRLLQDGHQILKSIFPLSHQLLPQIQFNACNSTETFLNFASVEVLPQGLTLSLSLSLSRSHSVFILFTFNFFFLHFCGILSLKKKTSKQNKDSYCCVPSMYVYVCLCACVQSEETS